MITRGRAVGRRCAAGFGGAVCGGAGFSGARWLNAILKPFYYFPVTSLTVAAVDRRAVEAWLSSASTF